MPFLSRHDPRTFLPALALAFLLPGGTMRAAGKTTRKVTFNRDVRPILSDICFQCHGPDKNKRKADLRLDAEEALFDDRGGYRILVKGKPDQSELYRRITAPEGEGHMPPKASGRKLTPAQIDSIRHWIEQGAVWQKHWAFMTPTRPSLPPVKNPDWTRNGIDHFVLARLEKEGLTPSREADRTTLIRRVTLDLTGLPPTPAEVDAFLADTGPDAYERLVDRLLASPGYGERMAIPWLDAARYADTNGYQSDGNRTMWRWRDWVIEALNANMPFDQFTVEQLAGDLLTHPTLEQRIATGFNRNHRGNAEGGIIPEEYAVEYVVDRVDTTATVWLGLTLGCARCHSHKYDPFTHKEYYRLFAFFNNVPERGKAVKYGNSPPMIPAPTRAQRKQLANLDARLQAARRAFAALGPQLERAETAWARKRDSARPITWDFRPGLVAHFPLDGSGKGTFKGGEATFVPGPVGKAARFDGKGFLDVGNVGDFGFYDKFTLAAWVFAADQRGGVVLSRMADTDRSDGYSLELRGGKVQLNLVKRWLDDALRVETVKALAPGCWHHVAATYDGSRTVRGVALYIDGQRQELKINLDDLNQSFQTKAPFRIGAGGGAESRFHGNISDVRVHDDSLSAEEVELVATPEPISKIAALPASKRTPRQAHKLRACFLDHDAPASIRKTWQQVLALREERQRLRESFPTTMVMEEMPRPRDTFVLLRGQYDKPGEKVTPGVPAVLPPMSRGAKANRLGLARWLVSRDNPLTARVTINRYWQMFFGTGLVKTAEDFGVQGEPPSHPELLDWLAREFMRSWDVKAMHRLIVTSATYRQSSRVSRTLIQKDPDNRLLARGSRMRLSAERIRDQALAVSGLLVERLGGPSVKPYQPKGLWEELAGTAYKQDRGENLYRRSLYTFWKRTIPPPSMTSFDATAREACTVHRSRTNTPLQALTLMNDVTFVEASRALAQRVLREGGKSHAERLTLAFRLATGRRPRPQELMVLELGLRQYLADYRKNQASARKLVRVGDSGPPRNVNVSELAAYTTVASMLLNLDEVVTRE
jgi:mono/diheme cytochrome c family protein